MTVTSADIKKPREKYFCTISIGKKLFLIPSERQRGCNKRNGRRIINTGIERMTKDRDKIK